MSSENGPKSIGAVLEGGGLNGSLARLQVRIAEQHRKTVEAAARPGESFSQTESRLRAESAAKEQEAAQEKARAQAAAIEAGRQRVRDEAAKEAAKAAPSSMRKPPDGDEQPDFFAPGFYDVSGRDSRHIMDVAVFRLGKKEKRAGEMIRYELSDGFVEVTAGPYGMASVWDYDIVLMMVSHLTEAMNRYRDGRGEKPGRTFRPHVSDILKFGRRGDGSRQVDEVAAALDRLKGTTIKSKRGKGKQEETVSDGLINNYTILSKTDTGRISSVEIEAPKWIHKQIVEGKRPDVLTIHADYFLITLGIGRFLYRLARRAAGKSHAQWSFKKLYAQSGSAGTFNKFSFTLREMIESNDLPEYSLAERPGKSGPLLVMTHRDALPDELPELPEDGDGAEGDDMGDGAALPLA